MAQYGSLINDEAKVLLQEKGLEAVSFSKEKFLELKKYAEDGNWSWRVAGFLAGLSIIGLSLMSFLSNIFGLSPFRAVLNIYMLFFGTAACILEFKEKALTQHYLDLLRREALFLYHPYGRAGFYFFVGVLVVAQGGLVNLSVGLYCAVIGMAIYQSSLTAFQELNNIRGGIEERDLDEKFDAFDKDKSGTLESCEFGNLVSSLGANMTTNQLESALFILDRNGDGKISRDEFKRWWSSLGEHQVPRRRDTVQAAHLFLAYFWNQRYHCSIL
eukprot:gene5759-6343_t